ncbi:hypothetical protein [Burkholderia vietnamiensis]|uniref:hypothetical protein n=1 Tax=Burkholderia vietnamiensis TaxID=60552 RepID=UPI001590D909|nr:hypothetical protein [Burkholderia vietnamiensis]
MPIPRNFKRWYTVSEAAEMLAKHFNEPVTKQDVVDEINAGDLPVWIDVTDRCAVSVARACPYYPDITKHPFYETYSAWNVDKLEKYARTEDKDGSLFYSDKNVDVLMGMYQVALIETTDYFTIPNGDRRSRTCFFDGIMVFDRDDRESLIKLVRRRVDTPEWSYDSGEFMDDYELPNIDDLRIATSDIFTRIESATNEAPPARGDTAVPLGDRAKTTLLKQIAVLAALVAEKDGEYKLGDRPNVKRIADAVGELVDALPDVSAHGLKNSNIRQNISDGLKLLRE